MRSLMGVRTEEATFTFSGDSECIGVDSEVMPPPACSHMIPQMFLANTPFAKI